MTTLISTRMGHFVEAFEVFERFELFFFLLFLFFVDKYDVLLLLSPSHHGCQTATSLPDPASISQAPVSKDTPHILRPFHSPNKRLRTLFPRAILSSAP